MKNQPEITLTGFYDISDNVLLPEKFVKCFVQDFAYGDTEINRGIIIALFNGTDRLPGHADKFSQLLLGEVLAGPGGF
jgi:hypothetical protein